MYRILVVVIILATLLSIPVVGQTQPKSPLPTPPVSPLYIDTLSTSAVEVGEEDTKSPSAWPALVILTVMAVGMAIWACKKNDKVH